MQATRPTRNFGDGQLKLSMNTMSFLQMFGQQDLLKEGKNLKKNISYTNLLLVY